MARPIPTGLILISAVAIFFTAMLLSSWPVVEGTTGAHELGIYFPAVPSASCGGGSIEQCMMLSEGEDGEGAELGEMHSESNRRILYGWRRYISYGALFRDRVPCSRRGNSYYNCRPGAHANPYTRGCSAITRCRGY